MEYFITFLLLVFISYNIFLFYLKFKIDKKEDIIREIFKERTGFIPGIFELSRDYLTRHDEIFKEILNLRKREFVTNGYKESFEILLEIETDIHHELNFIFNVCNKHNKLLKEPRFIYMRDIILKKSYTLGNEISNYKRIVLIYNKLIKINNLTFIGLFIPIDYKREF